MRIPTLFPYLLEEICKIDKIKKVSFISSNPWDFSDELIEVIAKNPKIDRNIHLPVQSGDDEILRKMNRRYTRDEYLKLIAKLKSKIKNVKISTDIIVGFPGETKKEFENTVKLSREVGFVKAYIACYSPRPGTAAWKIFADNVSHSEKNRRFHILDNLINKKKNLDG
jgi:tRNA-2-methylthio-N6-dimethylallyladenosine synthase